MWTTEFFSRGSGAQRFEIRGDSAHLILRKVLDHFVHDRRGAQSALNNERLLYQIVGVLPGEPRENVVAPRLRAVTGRAGRNTLRSDAFLKDLFAASHELCIACLGARWCLRSIVDGDGLNRGIAKLRCHAPHICERVGVGSRLIAKRVQLGLQVWGGLPGKIRKRRRDAAATDAMTARAGGFSQLVSRAPELGGNVGGSHSAARQRAGGKCHAEVCERLHKHGALMMLKENELQELVPRYGRMV